MANACVAAFAVLVAAGLVAVSGCICTCVTATAEVDDEFEVACLEHGGRVQHLVARKACVADAGVIATWVADDDAGKGE